ncbi:ABC transporter permease, partial [Streptococcus pneumoniae]|nr:ABC transporter permease [Streptococcus pneumoniae]
DSSAQVSALFGGVFFIGIFLSIIFMVGTVLVIYYKQISEGYEDRERFIILQKVGLDQKQIKQTINTQVLTVFFLPLLFAFLH